MTKAHINGTVNIFQEDLKSLYHFQNIFNFIQKIHLLQMKRFDKPKVCRLI